MIRRRSHISLILAGAALAGLCLPSAAPAQDGSPESTAANRVAEQPLATRSQLRSRLQHLRESVTDSVYTDARRREMREQIETIERRLEQGDFRQGDRVMLRVPAEGRLSGTFSVNRFRELELTGNFDNLDLSGVLYSEIDSVALEAVSQYVRNPRVQARVLWPVAITGGVAEPGYYNLAPGTTLSEALMEAGGPVQNAKLDEIAYRRGGRDLLGSRDRDGGEPLEVITLADLDARAGDELHVPPAGGGLGVTEVLGIASGLTGTVWAITRIF